MSEKIEVDSETLARIESEAKKFYEEEQAGILKLRHQATDPFLIEEYKKEIVPWGQLSTARKSGVKNLVLMMVDISPKKVEKKDLPDV